MGRSLKPNTKAFLVVLGITLLIWVLRGLTLLSFIPGWVLWVMILLSLAMAIVAAVR